MFGVENPGQAAAVPGSTVPDKVGRIGEPNLGAHAAPGLRHAQPAG